MASAAMARRPTNPPSPPPGGARPRPWRRPGAAPTGSPAPPLGVASRGGAASPAPARAPPASPRPAGLARSRCPALPGQGRRSRSPARGPVPATARSPARGHGAVARRGPVSPVGARRALPGRSWHGDLRPRQCVRSPGAARARTVPPASSPHPRLAAPAARGHGGSVPPALACPAPAQRGPGPTQLQLARPWCPCVARARFGPGVCATRSRHVSAALRVRARVVHGAFAWLVVPATQRITPCRIRDTIVYPEPPVYPPCILCV